MQPEDALGHARRAAGKADAPGQVARSFESELATDIPSDELMQQWAVISVEPSAVYSARRFGPLFTLLKRALVRVLRPYTTELEAQQTRFNVALLGRLRELERRRGE
jgi:hypothetical protein